jgi:diguanylate cyclase (GGDEF)-like protein
VDSLREGMVCDMATGLHADIMSGSAVSMGSGTSGEVVRKGEGVLGGAPLAEFGPATSDLLSAAVAPLRAEDEVIGTINIYHTQPRAYSAEDLRLLSLVARQAAVAIENARVFEQTKTSALTDPLTGLPNARYLFLHLEQEIGRSKRTGRPLSILGLDLDNFKPINDLFGHKQGDRVLKELAEVFKAQVREYDTVVRHAGDEFIVVLPEAGRLEAAETAARIKSAVERYDPRLRQRFDLQLGVSIGIATYPDDATEPGVLIAHADAQMYTDKRARKAERHLAGTMDPRDY